MNNLFRALLIMVDAHEGQTDKSGKSYISHPLRVASNFEDERYQIVAILHDVLEDSDKYTIDDFNFLDDDQIKAIKLLTHDKNDDYMTYVEKLSADDMARAIKLKDLEDNMDLSRLDSITSEDENRFKKYKKAKDFLLKKSTENSI